MKKQLVVICDMEGASGIFEHNAKVLKHGSEEWDREGRDLMTSDVLAVCEGANEFGIDEILIYDGHFAGCAKHNIKIEKLPSNARLVDTEDRCFYYRRIRGQAENEPYGIITVGQHARYGEEDAYFHHTIQSPPIKNLKLNGIHIAEIGMSVLNFQGVRYLANIGCAASMKEALELSEKIITIPVKDKKANWEPKAEETYGIIKKGVLEALRNREKAEAVILEAPYKFSMEVTEGYEYVNFEEISWKGDFKEQIACWEAPSVEIGLEIFNYVREHIKKK